MSRRTQDQPGWPNHDNGSVDSTANQAPATHTAQDSASNASAPHSRRTRGQNALGNARRTPRNPVEIIVIDEIDEDDDSEIVFLSSHTVPPSNIAPPGPGRPRRTRQTGRPQEGMSIASDGIEITAVQPTIAPLHIPSGFYPMDYISTLPNLRSFVRGLQPHFNYAQSAFNFSTGLDYSDEDEDETTPVRTFKSPSPATEGFTRDPKAGESYLCPNCNEELFEGEDEVKRQVWVLRACGHVYCGECTQNRAVRRAKKATRGDGRVSKPFKMCVVDGCTARASHAQAMTQLFI